MPPAHTKKIAAKPILTRKSTKGPLEGDEDPLAASLTSAQSSPPPPAAATSAVERFPELAPQDDDIKSKTIPSSIPERPAEKDLSFLLETAIYHPLGQVDVPSAFRRPFPAPPQPDTTIDDMFHSIVELLAQGHFLGAAHLSALVLTSSIISPKNYQAIFRLLAIRYSSLELSGNTLLAAQESKALEDLSSSFYYDGVRTEDESSKMSGQKRLPRHIMPFDLRLQAIRLQSIGFSDPRRGVSALYDLGMECREHLSSPWTKEEELAVWKTCLEDVGVQVVNALIETGDLDCAKRTLDTMKSQDEKVASVLTARKILLAVKMGDTNYARNLVTSAKLAGPEKSILQSVLDVAAGRYLEARETLSTIPEKTDDTGLLAIAKQNLAVAELYIGELETCRTLFEDLVRTEHSFQTLMMNLATVYELSSDRARDLKLQLIDNVAGRADKLQHRAYVNADFKL